MKRIVRMAICMAVIGVIATSCISGNRLWRATPSLSEGLKEDRVQLWPLFYKSGGMVSVLWPLMDFDDEGFAVRPFVAKDGSEWSVAWPMAGWDSANGKGWVGNVFFNTKDGRIFIFPVAYHDQNFRYLATAYRTKDPSGLFPLFHAGKNGYAGPAYWSRDAWGLFPINYMKKDLSKGYVGPL